MNDNKIREALKELEKGVKKYLIIMKQFHNVNVSLDKGFRTKYNGFYRVRHPNRNFYDGYYSLMEKSKKDIPLFKDILHDLYQYNRLEVSFSSKLLATIDPNLPVWDQYVLKFFKLKTTISRYMKPEERIIEANNVYEEIKQKYSEFLRKEKSNLWIKLFDKYYPNSNITPIKKIDLIIWQLRE
jgi:hypothetical protein